ncbi:MAG: hypothetical protein KKB50_11325 [Planctomycetes bacterium]|nr:hypothetical protein [Planctomycetota bacterium]
MLKHGCDLLAAGAGARARLLAVGLAAAVIGAVAVVHAVQEREREQEATLAELVARLGDEQYDVREQATRSIFKLGRSALPQLREFLAQETDPETTHRLRFLLDNMIPPDRAALVVRAEPASGLNPGDLITHANGRRVRTAAALHSRLNEADGGLLLRVQGQYGPREVGPVGGHPRHAYADYHAPRGDALAEIIRLYAAGYAERAYQLLQTVPPPIPEGELSAALRARIAYTAGDGAMAWQLVADKPALAQPAQLGNLWSDPSRLDLTGPGRAPLRLEWRLWSTGAELSFEHRNDPDLRVQRVLVPARRYADALGAAAEFWSSRYRSRLGENPENAPAAGNMLAVMSWMLSEMDLLSECCRLIEPRSVILRRAEGGVRKWMRVQTDAWLPFLAGSPKQALDGFYEDAQDVLRQASRRDHETVLVRQPEVAAMIAFFLYQTPADPRALEMLRLVNRPGQAGLSAYVHWMCYGLHEANHEPIRAHLAAILPSLANDEVGTCAFAVALLELLRTTPNDDVLATARERLAQSSAADTPQWLVTTDVLRCLAAGQVEAARQVLASCGGGAQLAALRHTLDFADHPPPGADRHAELLAPLLAVPIGPERDVWLIVTRDRRLLRFDAASDQLAALEKPTDTWFPGPLNWPWIGREENSGRVWLYDRRRVIEIAADDRAPLRLNISARDIPAFARFVSPVFSTLAGAAAALPPDDGEQGEFLRAELRANGEFVANPAFPEIGFIRPLAENERVVHVAFRGGPHVLIDTTTGRAWTSAWMAERLGLGAPPAFLAQGMWPWEGAVPGAELVVFLMSDQGLLRFDVADETLERLELPGDEPHPAVIPESCPYTRRDARWVYCARLPEAGGQVYRLNVGEQRIEAMDMVNEMLPAGYYDTQSRAALRAALEQRLTGAGLPVLDALIADAAAAVARWEKQQP